MGITAKIIADSINPFGNRLTTLQLKYPRFIHAEFMTHRAFSRNSSSSRAVPVDRMMDQEIVFPVRWGKNQKGMQPSQENLDDIDSVRANNHWIDALMACSTAARALSSLGVHKQWANRMLEWFTPISVVVSATEWDNFFELRDHPDAQDEIRILAQEIRKAMAASTPEELEVGEWHLPYITQGERRWVPLEDRKKISVARCARVSYLKHDGTHSTREEDLALFERLVGSNPKHLSPTEHQARASHLVRCANFQGWRQYRKEIE